MTIALEHNASLTPADCCADHLLYRGKVQSAPRDFRFVHGYVEDRQPFDLLDFDIGCSLVARNIAAI